MILITTHDQWRPTRLVEDATLVATRTRNGRYIVTKFRAGKLPTKSITWVQLEGMVAEVLAPRPTLRVAIKVQKNVSARIIGLLRCNDQGCRPELIARTLDLTYTTVTDTLGVMLKAKQVGHDLHNGRYTTHI